MSNPYESPEQSLTRPEQAEKRQQRLNRFAISTVVVHLVLGVFLLVGYDLGFILERSMVGTQLNEQGMVLILMFLVTLFLGLFTTLSRHLSTQMRLILWAGYLPAVIFFSFPMLSKLFI